MVREIKDFKRQLLIKNPPCYCGKGMSLISKKAIVEKLVGLLNSKWQEGQLTTK